MRRAVLLAACALPLLVQAQTVRPWFVEGRAEYDRVSHLSKPERTRQRDALLRWAAHNRASFSCCDGGLQIQDARRGGAVFLIFLAQQFGDYIVDDLQNDKSGTFDAALANQTKPYELTLLFTRFEAWLAAPFAFDRPADRFITVNGVKLQHVDWGGRGDYVLFLPGLGDSVHRFDAIAPRFTTRWHAVGYSRRGQGESDKPPSGYDTNTLVEDLRAFLDANHIQTVNLIGHSLAGTEMTVFASRFPARVRHVVYLDAAYDFAAGREVASNAGRPARRGPSPVEQLDYEMGEHHLDFTTVRSPALAFFVLYDRPEDPAGIRPEFRLPPWLLPYLKDQLANFRRTIPHGEAVELRNTDHIFFNDPRIETSVVHKIQSFLQNK
jgi:pimeloyl-ACP methyl ester carboxylesterase